MGSGVLLLTGVSDITLCLKPEAFVHKLAYVYESYTTVSGSVQLSLDGYGVTGKGHGTRGWQSWILKFDQGYAALYALHLSCPSLFLSLQDDGLEVMSSGTRPVMDSYSTGKDDSCGSWPSTRPISSAQMPGMILPMCL
jgi:hypothetical protein